MSIVLDEFGMIAPSSGGGGGGGSMTFYKCSAVDTTNRTWSGYLASIDPVTGVWSFAATATSGLEYDRITPEVGRVYDADCTFEVLGYKTGLPENGLIFYLPLDADPGATDVKGNTLYKGNPSYLNYGQLLQGVYCTTTYHNYTGITGPDFASTLPNSSDTAFTVSSWLGFVDKSTTTGFGILTARGDSTAHSSFGFKCGVIVDYSSASGSFKYTLKTGNTGNVHYIYDVPDGIHHLAATFGAGAAYLYLDGVSVGSYNWDYSTPFGTSEHYYPGILHINTVSACYHAAFRIYNRVLDAQEIAALAAEFTPVAS